LDALRPCVGKEFEKQPGGRRMFSTLDICKRRSGIRDYEVYINCLGFHYKSGIAPAYLHASLVLCCYSMVCENRSTIDLGLSVTQIHFVSEKRRSQVLYGACPTCSQFVPVYSFQPRQKGVVGVVCQNRMTETNVKQS
jgi:hypothetical protein